jgi:uncharacterized repeat protein (TIGR02543 family)
VQVVASIIDTGGYTDAEGTYTPVVGIYDTNPAAVHNDDPNGQPILLDAPDLSKPIEVTVVDTYARSRVTFNANGGTLVGPQVITVVEPQTTLPYLPASPIRDGYTFRHWATAASGGTQFTADTTLSGDITLYALWNEIPAIPIPEPQTPPNVIINNPPANVGGAATYVTVGAGNDTESSTLPDTSAPLSASEGISNVTPPLASGGSASTGWALFDLLATILALLLLVACFVKFFFDRPRVEEYEEESIDAQLWEAMTPDQRAQYQAHREAEYQTWLVERQIKANRQKAAFVNLPVLLIAGTALVEALLVLFTTQHFELNMSIVDDYSVIFALVVFVQLLTPMVAAIIHNNHRENQRLREPVQPSYRGEMTV